MITPPDTLERAVPVQEFLAEFRQKQRRLRDLQDMAIAENFVATPSLECFRDGLTIAIPAKLVREYIQIESIQLERELTKLQMKFHDILKILEGD